MEITRRKMVLTFLEREGAISLGMKDRDIAVGKWNAYGGKVLEGEELEEAAKRELLEESGVIANSLEYRGYVDFHRNDKINEVHMYMTADFEGEPAPQTGENGEPAEFVEMVWIKKEELPYGEMMEGDRYWIPKMLEEGYVEGEIHYSDDWELMEHSFGELQSPREFTLR